MSSNKTAEKRQYENIMDKLVSRIDEMNSPIVAGIDTTLEMIPEAKRISMFEQFGSTPATAADLLLSYNKTIIDSISDLVPAVKPQIAMYEKYGLDGIRAYLETIEYARSKGLIVIGDIKRGDIASTAEAYASHLSGVEIEGNTFDTWQEDMVTVNPYFGIDGINPFTKACKETGKGIFVLVKTSNPGSGELQDLLLIKGCPVYMTIAMLAESWGADMIGAQGFSSVGIVVGATHPETGRQLRDEFPKLFFLVPGYGAQGATAEDLRGFFNSDGRGCLINSSRGIIAAWQKDRRFDAGNVGEAAREAVLKMKAALQ